MTCLLSENSFRRRTTNPGLRSKNQVVCLVPLCSCRDRDAKRKGRTRKRLFQIKVYPLFHMQGDALHSRLLLEVLMSGNFGAHIASKVSNSAISSTSVQHDSRAWLLYGDWSGNSAESLSAADSFVISSECRTPLSGSPRYNLSPPSTYREDDASTPVDYGLINTSASSRKTLSILVVTKSLASFSKNGPLWDSLSIIEGVLGLSTPSDIVVAMLLSRKQLVPFFEHLLRGVWNMTAQRSC